MSLSEKYRNWKTKRETQFKNLTPQSWEETKQASKKYADCYYNDTAIENTFAYEFKNPSHQKKLQISKKINFISLFVLACLLLVISVLYGCITFANLIDPSKFKPEEFHNVNITQWCVEFLPSLIVCACSVIYLSFSLSFRFIRNKKLKNNLNYTNTYSINLAWDIVFALSLLFTFFMFKPFNLISIYCFNLLSINPVYSIKFLLISSGIIGIVEFICYLIWLISFILCRIYNPKFKLETLTKNK